jgi:hypothetical protein
MHLPVTPIVTEQHLIGLIEQRRRGDRTIEYKVVFTAAIIEEIALEVLVGLCDRLNGTAIPLALDR